MPVFHNQNKKLQSGFTIMELIVSIAIFAILLAGMLGAIATITKTTKAARDKTTLSSLATNYLEIVRNMPYSQVGTLLGNPHGNLPDLPNAIVQTIGDYRYNIFYKVSYVHDPADPVVGAADYKQVKMSILNLSTNQLTDFITTVVPKGLITDPNTGALQVKVINSQGLPVGGASVTITYPTTTPIYIFPDVADRSGQVTEIGLPAGVHSYRVVVTAGGYSTDQTYPVTVANPNPVHPDPTVATGTITQLTLSIDTLANLNIKTLDSTCHNLNGVNLNVLGSKLIGAGPNVNKFNNNYSSSAGLIALNNIEWDTYTPTLLAGEPYVVYGTSPIQAINVLPATTQTYTMILGPLVTPNNLLVIVKDAASGTALENASVTLTQGSSTIGTLLTGGSVWVQNDWSLGGGLAQWSSSTPSQYFQDNGNVDVSNAGNITIKRVGFNYPNATGTLESSTFDTGTSLTNYTILSWQPSSQSASTTVMFQVAANNDNSTWNYIGPDGTSGSYFTTPGSDMGSALDSNRYFRYKAYLQTNDPSKTPDLTSVNVNFVTGCFTPGQVIFANLAGGSYAVSVSLAGYSPQNNIPLNISGPQAPLQVLMSP